MELSYYFANEHYQKSSEQKPGKSAGILNLKQIQDDVDKKIRNFEMIITGFLFPLKILKRLVFWGLLALFLILATIFTVWFFQSQDMPITFGDSARLNLGNETLAVNRTNVDEFLPFKYFDCVFVEGNLKCGMKGTKETNTTNESHVKINESVSQTSEPSTMKSEESFFNLKTNKTEVVWGSVEDVDFFPVQTENSKLNSKSKNLKTSQQNSESKFSGRKNKINENKNETEELKLKEPKVSNFQPVKEYQRKSRHSPFKQERTATNSQLVSSKRTQILNPEFLPKSQLPVSSSRQFPKMENRHRLLQSVEQPQIDVKMFEKNTYLVFDEKVYELEKVATNRLNFLQKMALSLLILSLLYITVASGTYFLVDKSVIKRINETIISMVIIENNSNGIYKFFIYGDYKYVGVKVIIKDAKMDDLRGVSQTSDSYMLDPNQIQARKLNLVKKNKRNNQILKNTYRNLSNSRGEISSLDLNESKINETVG